MGKGPTFTFKIMRYSTNADIHMLLPRAKRLSAKNLGSPLVILNGFGVKSDSKETTKDGVTEFTTGPQERQITSTMFNNLFPGLNLGRVKHSTLKRVVLVNYEAERDLVEVRHYYIRQNHTDMNNKIKKMVNNKKLPNLGDCKDLSQYFTGNVGYVSESDIDMLPNSKINVEEENNKGKVTKRKVNLRLFEIGPRMTLKLVKIEEGFMGGEIFYHRYRKKTHREKKEQKSLIEQKLKMKEDRKKTQEANVAAKEEKMQELQDKLNKRVVRDKRFELLGKRDPADLEKGLEEIDKVEYEEGMVPDEELVEHNENDDDVDYVDDDQDPDGDHHGNDNEDEDSVGDGEHAGEPDSEEEEGEELGDFDNYETNFV
jgi:ribosome biogenesis protein SSF1/2